MNIITIKPYITKMAMCLLALVIIAVAGSCTAGSNGVDRTTSPHYFMLRAEDIEQVLTGYNLGSPAAAGAQFCATYTWNGNTPAPPPLPPTASYGDWALNLFNNGTGVWKDASYNTVSSPASATYACWDL